MNDIKGLSYATSPLSEYIGSHIYQILGYDVHKTLLGICFDGKRYKVVCACKDFIKDDKTELLIPYTALRNDTNPEVMGRDEESSLSASNINEIIFQLDHNTVLKNIKNAKERFWDVVLIDMLINNNDRNEDNWGVIKDKTNSTYRLSPIYDCGNCFYGKTSEERILEILSDEARLLSSALNGITAYEDDEEKRIRNEDIVKLNNGELRNSIYRVYTLFSNKMGEITNFINEIPESYQNVVVMSSQRKKYYIKTIMIRLEKILFPCVTK
ncbi:MAG: CtkA family protein [Bacilli bacterium]|nr:CtkA family protein [Bacilli bacterium]